MVNSHDDQEQLSRFEPLVFLTDPSNFEFPFGDFVSQESS